MSTGDPAWSQTSRTMGNNTTAHSLPDVPSPAAELVSLDLLAHQGGWDEALFVLVPLAVFAALLAVANRR